MKTIKAFIHVPLVIVVVALVIYGLNELDLIDPIVKNVEVGIEHIKSNN